MFLSGASTLSMRDPADHVRRYTRQSEFEFVGWTLESLSIKLGQFSLGVTEYLTEEERVALVLDYFVMLNQFQQVERELENVLSDPANTDPSSEASSLREQTLELRSELDRIQPLVETILQEQVAVVLSDFGLGIGGKIIPSVAFKFSQLPVTLIVSPREVIRMDANIPLVTNLTIDQKIMLEDQVAQDLDVSSLIVNIGGIGLYPTMVLESSSLRWIVETIVHEWVHNYLTLRPLGLSYEKNAELRTMNETVASLLGEEFGYFVLERYYPEFAPDREITPPTTTAPSADPPKFDFRAEMHETRIKADQLLAQGLIEEAEAYMEERRQFIWENGYRIRKLNQAYFAFHGAYADAPQGAAGEDPVGKAVREYWAQLDSPVDFLIHMSWMDQFSDLERALEELNPTP